MVDVDQSVKEQEICVEEKTKEADLQLQPVNRNLTHICNGQKS